MASYYSGPDSPAPAFETPGGVWPPPPVGQIQAPLTGPACPFRTLYRRAPGKIGTKANISDLRVGTIEFDPEGLIIQGKAVPRAEIRTSVMIPLVLLSLLIAAIVGTIMEYALRHDERLGVRWSDVREICLSPTKQEACIVYDGPNYAGKIKTFSLGFRLGPDYFPLFAQSAQQFAPTLLREGRLRNATPLILWIILGVLLAAILGAILWASLSPTRH